MRKPFAVLAAGALLLAFSSCTTPENSDDPDVQRGKSVETRAKAFARAERLHPIPKTNNFPLRKALVKFTERQDLENHPWYVYILGQNGNIIGYYVAQTVPVNACNFLSSTEEVDPYNELVLTAPSLDGIYYGGGGTSAGCDAWFFFDQATDALIQIRGLHFFATDQPLKVAADPILVETTKK